jgi:hypothetical protein
MKWPPLLTCVCPPVTHFALFLSLDCHNGQHCIAVARNLPNKNSASAVMPSPSSPLLATPLPLTRRSHHHSKYCSAAVLRCCLAVTPFPLNCNPSQTTCAGWVTSPTSATSESLLQSECVSSAACPLPHCLRFVHFGVPP